ncbi:MAG: hypothetical protein A2V70_08025 [Planctomycetes bacterium RBG_13_63_9]|nr:MAG: hypothetical protein A2V70_08025 [Planctomycetes bacterium RBG_13_63_9]
MVELLVVISIVVLLAAIAIPALRPTLEGQRIREAARAINVYLGSARNRAVVSGRPCGVILQRFDGQPQCAMVLQQAEVPPPYSGDTLDSTAQVRVGATLQATMTPNITSTLVSAGDLVQFNRQGPFYRIEATPSQPTATQLELSIDVSQGQMLPWPRDGSLSAPVPYAIFRRPVKSAAAPLQLPTGAVVDLEASGTDDHLFGVGTAPVTIMFSPNGSLERVYEGGNPVVPVTEPIFLLVGRRERVTGLPLSANPSDEEKPNWADPANLWVSINPQTGLVTTTENNPVSPMLVDYTDPTTWLDPHIRAARTFAREGQSMGGR